MVFTQYTGTMPECKYMEEDSGRIGIVIQEDDDCEVDLGDGFTLWWNKKSLHYIGKL